MRKVCLVLLSGLGFICASSQPLLNIDSLRNARKDSSLRAAIRADSLRIEKEFADKEKEDKLDARLVYPFLNAGKNSGIIPVKDPTEIPDPNIDYKILFELVGNNPDSTSKDVNYGLAEIARVINLHIASGIPAKRIIPVIVVHAGAIHAIKNNEAYQKKYKIDNPSIKIIDDLKKMGAKFSVCGQAMAYFDVKKEDLLADIKVSVTAQTVLTHYQLKGYVWHPIW